MPTARPDDVHDIQIGAVTDTQGNGQIAEVGIVFVPPPIQNVHFYVEGEVNF